MLCSGVLSGLPESLEAIKANQLNLPPPRLPIPFPLGAFIWFFLFFLDALLLYCAAFFCLKKKNLRGMHVSCLQSGSGPRTE